MANLKITLVKSLNGRIDKHIATAHSLGLNAGIYSEGGDKITINIYYVENRQILLVFKDNGIGMDEREVKSIFEEGFRGSNSKEKQGTGYGLYDVKTIVERYGGTVEISSREKAGFSVYMLFPAYEEEKGSDT